MDWSRSNPTRYAKRDFDLEAPCSKQFNKVQSSLSLSLKCALRESGCRIGYKPTKKELRSPMRMSRDTNVEVSALSPESDTPLRIYSPPQATFVLHNHNCVAVFFVLFQ